VSSISFKGADWYFLQLWLINCFSNSSVFAMAGKKCACPSRLSTTIGASTLKSNGVWVSLKYTKIGKLLLGKNSQLTKLL
jgi:hypothetical protein